MPPNFTFTVANESPSRLLTWPEASLPATAVTGRIKASSTAVAVSTTVAFCPGTRLHVLWEQALQCASRFRPMRSRRRSGRIFR